MSGGQLMHFLMRRPWARSMKTAYADYVRLKRQSLSSMQKPFDAGLAGPAVKKLLNVTVVALGRMGLEDASFKMKGR